MALKRLILALAMVLALSPEPARTADYVRLHVIADSDDAPAQAMKLEVHDACLDAARALLSDCADADEAWALLNEHLPALAGAAERAARARGWTGAVRAETGVYAFPERQYGDVLVPAGEYRALRIVIGAGEGRNWWCVLYPSLCLPEDLPEGEPVPFYSAILEWIKSLFGGDDP